MSRMMVLGLSHVTLKVILPSSQNGVTGPDARCVGYIVSWRNYNAEPQAERNRSNEEGTIFGFRCPRRDDYSRDSRARWGGAIVRDHPQSRRVGAQAGEEVEPSRATAGLLRGRPDGLRSVLAADGFGSEV